MKKPRYAKKRRIQQRNLERVTCKTLLWHIIIITIIMFITLCNMPRVVIAEKEDASKSINESYEPQAEQAEEELSEVEVDCYPEFTYSKDWSAKESYLLARIAMAEAEGCNTQTKTLIIMCVLNRVCSNEFPDTIEEVIFQENQFSPINNGRWDRVEPNEDCYEAVKIVIEAKYDYSGGATYFESCDNEDNWHSRSLEFLYESEGIRFYK